MSDHEREGNFHILRVEELGLADVPRTFGEAPPPSLHKLALHVRAQEGPEFLFLFPSNTDLVHAFASFTRAIARYEGGAPSAPPFSPN